MTKYVRKRDGSFVAFQREKIAFAIQRAMEASCPDMTVEEMEETAEKLAEEVEFQILNDRTTQVPSVEAIQDEVEKVIIRHNLAEVAKAYILYRKKRQMIRESANSLSGQLKEIFDSSSIDSDLKRDNANVDGNSAMGTMLQVGAAASKLFFSENYLTEEQKQANQCGDIHIHDFDFYALTETCCQIDFKALAECGFSTGHGFIRPPQSIQSYAALACIAIQANQNDQHGGQSIPNFDYAMAQGVKKTYAREFERILCEYYEEMKGKEPDEEKEFVHQILTDIIKTQPAMVHHEKFDTVLVSTLMVSVFGYMNKEYQLILDEIVARIHKKAYLMTEKATHQAMESLVHNLNSMHSRAGAQVPFSSLNYGTDTSAEGRMAIRQLLLATEEGLGNGETPIFPIQIFKVKEGVNYNEGDPNYDLFRLAMKVSAKRLFPNFTFIDAPFNLQYYVPGHPETEVATMGCRTRVMGNVHDPATIDENGVYHPNGEVAYGRGNLSFTSINLPRLAILANGDEEMFFESLGKMMNLVARQLLDRLEIQSRRRVYNYPFLMGQGVWRGSEKLSPDDEVREVLKHGSLSIGFIGLAETLVALYGHHHGESDEMEEKGLKIIRFMRAFTDRKAQETGLNFTLLATPAEGLSGYFVRKDKKLFGEIPGVTDRDYYTNSFHVPVHYTISAYEKIQKEAPFHALCNAGHISYVELDGDIATNLEAFEAVVRCMHDAGIGYGSMDFGLKHFLNLDDGSVIDSPQWYKVSLKELRAAHRAVSRCQKGSRNRRRAIQHLERVYQRISNRRRDWFFKLANQLVSEYAIICIEDLNLDGMKRLWGRKVSDLAFAEFVSALEWVAGNAGTAVVKIDRWAPSSKACHVCGTVNGDLTLKQRSWECDCCHTSLDRDTNAAINIKQMGLAMLTASI